MKHARLFSLLAVVILVSAFAPAALAQGTLLIESEPDAAALYLGDLAYLHDEFTLPAGLAAQVVLPGSAIIDSLVITEGGARVPGYRVQTVEGRPAVQWEPAAGEGERAVVLDYLATGAGWSPIYDMTILAPDQVRMGFEARVFSTGLTLDGVDLRLVAGMPGGSSYTPNMTITQSNVGYFNEQEQGATSVGGSVEIAYVYPLGTQSLGPGETLRWNLVAGDLDARRLLVWDARVGQRVDVIYKVNNSTDVPFVEGSVRAYQDGLYVGEDPIEWTPVGSEGSVTVAGLSNVRVRRTESVEMIGTVRDDRYQHEIILAVTNHGDEAIDMTVLDEWNVYGFDYTYSAEPVRQGNNVLRWAVSVPAGETLEITYGFTTD